MTRPRVNLRIDRITVTGAHPSRRALAQAIEAELHGLLSAPGALEALRGAGAVERLDDGRVAPAAPGEAALGRAVAGATMEALKRSMEDEAVKGRR